MKAKLSPLQLTDFQLLNLQYRFVNPTDTDEIDTDELFGDYGLDVDFAIKRQDDNNFTIFTKADINSDGAQSGYVLFAEGVSSFHIAEPSTLPEARLQNLLVFSGVGIAMQQLRSRVADLTSFAPFGKYMLPTLDMDDLLKQKQEHNKQEAHLLPPDTGKKASLTQEPDKQRNKTIFKEVLLKKLQTAQQQELSFIDVNAGDLHREGGGINQVPACVNAMKRVMLPGDAILVEPPKGVGPSVTIRYKLPR